MFLKHTIANLNKRKHMKNIWLWFLGLFGYKPKRKIVHESDTYASPSHPHAAGHVSSSVSHMNDNLYRQQHQAATVPTPVATPAPQAATVPTPQTITVKT